MLNTAEDKFYIKENLEQKLTWKDQGLKSWEAINKEKLPEAKTGKMSFDQAKEMLDKKQNGYNDYHNRLLSFSIKTLKAHNKPDRLAIFNLIDDILLHPDEVYLAEKGSNKTYQLRYIKFYKDKPVIVISEINGEEMQIKTWFEMDTDKIDRDWRQGILIKK